MAERAHAEPSPAFSRRPAGSLPTAHARGDRERGAGLGRLFDLQQSIGNRAVGRLLQATPRATASPARPLPGLPGPVPAGDVPGARRRTTRAAKAPASPAAEAERPSRAMVAPAQDPAFHQAAREVRLVARRQKVHDDSSVKRAEVKEAAALTTGEQEVQSAKEQRTGEMQDVGETQRKAGERFSADEFKRDFAALVRKQKAPTTEKKVKEFAEKPPIAEFPATLSAGIATKGAEVAAPLERKADAPLTGGTAVEPGDIPAAVRLAPPQPMDPARVTPKPRPDAEVTRPPRREAERIEGAMQEQQLSDDQLAESREPSFLETLRVKREAQRRVAETAQAYRAEESAVLDAAQVHAQEALSGRFGVMSGTQARTAAGVFVGQKGTETQTERRQREIKEKIDGIYTTVVEGVKATLLAMANGVKEQFANGLARQTREFNERVRRRISDYYGDWRIDDKLFGPAPVVVNPDDGSTRPLTMDEIMGRAKRPDNVINPAVYRIFKEERDTFIAGMDRELDAVADVVQNGLNAAHLLIVLGRTGIAIFKATLSGEELAFASRLEEEVQLKFENLEGTIDDARDDLLQTLADQYAEHVNQLETTFRDINDELKKSWIDRAVDFIVTVGKTIFQLAELLFTILVRVQRLVWDIIRHPIRFFETLVAGLMQGIAEFVGSIGTHLQEAFWTWISGATPVANIRLSVGSGLESLFDLVTQVLSLTTADLREMVEKVLGKELMALVDRAIARGEKVFEPVVLLLTKGPVALWEYVKDTVGSLVQSSFDRIRESVFYGFVEKGLKWVAGFFVPGGGFVKIVKAIFRAFQFVAENLANIRHFFDAVFDSMEAAVQGSTAGVAGKVVVGLKTGVVLALDFLAKLIGMDRIVDGVQKTIRSLRRPIVSAIEWVLRKARPIVMRMLRAVGIGGKEEPGEQPVPALAADAGDVRNVAFRALAGELREEHTGPETVAVVASVGERLRPKGLRSLEIVPGKTDADAIVYAEASPRLPLAHLRRRAREKPAGRTVTAAVELTLSGPARVTEGAFASAGGGPRQPTGGQVLPRTARAGHVVRAVTWNTSNIEQVSNYSDAEHQFVNWMEHNRHLMPLVESIVLSVFHYIPCSGCANELAWLLTEIKKVQDREGARVIRRADLYWSKLYVVKSRPTSWGSINALRRSGWSLHAPLDAYPQTESDTRGELRIEKGGLWRLEGSSLAPARPASPPDKDLVAVDAAVWKRARGK